MNSEMFCYWLKGFVELADSKVISEAQWTVIKDHLNLVHEKVTPKVNVNYPSTEPLSLSFLEKIQKFPVDSKTIC